MNAKGQATIVVGTDGSAHADRAIAWALEEAKLRGAHLRIVSVWHVPAMVYGAPGFGSAAAVAMDETFRKVAEEAAAGAAERARAAGVRVEALVEQGQAADVLIEAAADADLLVVGSRGHGGFAGLLLGSVSAQCSHHPPCPLVIVPAKRT